MHYGGITSVLQYGAYSVLCGSMNALQRAQMHYKREAKRHYIKESTRSLWQEAHVWYIRKHKCTTEKESTNAIQQGAQMYYRREHKSTTIGSTSYSEKRFIENYQHEIQFRASRQEKHHEKNGSQFRRTVQEILHFPKLDLEEKKNM